MGEQAPVSRDPSEGAAGRRGLSRVREVLRGLSAERNRTGAPLEPMTGAGVFREPGVNAIAVRRTRRPLLDRVPLLAHESMGGNVSRTVRQYPALKLQPSRRAPDTPFAMQDAIFDRRG